MASAPGARHPRPAPSSSTLYTDITHLATFSSQLGDLKGASIFVRGNVIEWVGESSAVPRQLQQEAEHVVSCKDLVIIPGLVNTHHHMWVFYVSFYIPPALHCTIVQL
jgi:8-oxoguanine deaminase